MKILINTASTYKGGGIQVARSFIEESRNFQENEYHVILSELLSNLIVPKEYPDNFFFYTIGYRPATRVFSLKSQDKFFKEIENQVKPDVVFTTSGPSYWKPKAPHLVGYNRAHHIYRESIFFSQISFLKRLKWKLKRVALKYFFKRDANAYVVQTDDVNKRLRHWLLTDNVYTVSNTVSQHYLQPKEVSNKLPEKGEDEFRFLTLSAWYAHKNLGIIPHIIEELPEILRERVRFVLTLPINDYKREIPEKYHGTVYNVGPVPPEEGPSLYKECDALFLPTLLECFSASYPEAMQMKRPIVTSDLGFAHTVCGEAALYADPMSPREFARNIERLIQNPDLHYQLVRNGKKQLQQFMTAEERAEAYLKICKKLVDERKN